MYIVLLRYSLFRENVCMLYLNAAPFYIRDLNVLGFWYPQWIWNQPTEKILLKNQLNLNVLICMKKTIYTGMKKKIFNKEQCYASVLDDSVM